MEFVADLHIHTVASGHAYSTVLENARAAADRGLALIAMTDHGPSMPGGAHRYHFGNQKAIPDTLFGVRVLKGIEANIIDAQGCIDLSEYELARLDVVQAGLHTACSPTGTEQENTESLIRAMGNPWVDVIVHPGNPEYPIQLEEFVRAAVTHDVAIEINNSSLTVSRPGSRERCKRIAQLAGEYGAKILLGTDSHFAFAIGDFAQASLLLQESGLDATTVLNVSVERILQHLNRRNNRLQPVEF